MDEALWRQSEIVMSDCRATLSELGVLVDKINEDTDSKGLGWRARVASGLNAHRDEIEGLRDKIHKSTSALRTVLHTITVYDLFPISIPSAPLTFYSVDPCRSETMPLRTSSSSSSAS